MKLITTAYKGTESVPEADTLFLGAWCQTYDKEGNEKNFNVLPYHWENREKAAKDSEYLNDLCLRLAPILSQELNKLHKTNFSERSWYLMIGYWLTQFLAVAFDRWSMLQAAENDYTSLTSDVINENRGFQTPNNSEEATDQFIDDKWNHTFIGKIMEKWTNIEITKKNFENDTSTVDIDPIRIHNIKKIKKLLKKSASLFLALSRISKKRYVIYSSRLSTEGLLHFWFRISGKVYYEPIFPTLPKFDYDKNMRNWKLLISESDTLFEKIVKELIPLWIPMVYVEGLSTVHNLIEAKKLPGHPDVIFTANKHFNDDVFKYWAATKIDSGSKLVIGQHGGRLNKFNGALAYESNLGDLYAAIGGINGGLSHFRNVGQFWARFTYGKWNQLGMGIIVTVAMPRYAFDLRSMALAGQMLSYFEDQFAFYGNLPSEIQAQMRIRLYPVDYGWNQKQRWLDHFPSVQLDEGSTPIKKIVKKCRLFISTYNATTYLESLAANIPTVIYWDKHYWEWPEWADDDFSALQSVGIFHETPESAAKHVTVIWDNVAQWWSAPKLQSVRQKFCRKYAHRHPSVITRLADVLREAAES